MPNNNLPVYQPQHYKDGYFGNSRPLLLITHPCIDHTLNMSYIFIDLAITDF